MRSLTRPHLLMPKKGKYRIENQISSLPRGRHHPFHDVFHCWSPPCFMDPTALNQHPSPVTQRRHIQPRGALPSADEPYHLKRIHWRKRFDVVDDLCDSSWEISTGMLTSTHFVVKTSKCIDIRLVHFHHPMCIKVRIRHVFFGKPK